MKINCSVKTLWHEGDLDLRDLVTQPNQEEGKNLRRVDSKSPVGSPSLFPSYAGYRKGNAIEK